MSLYNVLPPPFPPSLENLEHATLLSSSTLRMQQALLNCWLTC